MNDAHFDISGCQLEKASQRGVVTITRDKGLFQVRPHHGRRSYTLPLSTVAEMVVAKVVKSELQAEGKPVPQPRRGR